MGYTKNVRNGGGCFVDHTNDLSIFPVKAINLINLALLVGLPEKYTGLDDVAKPLYPNVYIFPFLPQVAFAREFMVNVHRAIPTRS